MSPASPAPRRVGETIFRRDMLGPSFGHIMASIVGLVVVQKVVLEHAMCHVAPTIELLEAMLGRYLCLMVSSIAVTTAGYWGVGGLFSLPAMLHVEKWKIKPNKKLDMTFLAQALPLTVFNHFAGVIVTANLLYLVAADDTYDWRAVPSTATLFRDAAVALILEETLFYYAHRWMHEDKRMYAAVHKLHHTWHDPIAIVAIYCHPFEHIFCNILPVMIGPVLCGMNLNALGVFLFLAMVHTTGVHSGYWFCDDNGMHHEHHVRFNVNYGAMGLMDSLHGTYALPDGAAGKPRGSASATKPRTDGGEVVKDAHQ